MLSRTQSDWLTSISCCVTQSLLVLPNKTEPLVICAFPAITRGNCVCHLAIFPWRRSLPSKCSSEKNLDLKSYLLCPCPCSSQIPPQGGSRIHRSPMTFIQDTSAITAHYFYTIGCKKKQKKGYKNSPSTSLGTGFLFHIDMIASQRCCRSVRCKSMIWNSHSSISQRCSLGLRSGGGGGHLSTASSLLYSRNQSEIIWALWPGTLSLVDYTLLPKRDGYCIISNSSYSGGILNDAQY